MAMILNNADKIMLGSNEVSNVYQGGNLIWQNGVYYGGLRAMFDNAGYSGQTPNYAPYDQYTYLPSYFLLFVDSGDTSAKSIEFGYVDGSGDGAGKMKTFTNNPLTRENNNDYWGMGTRTRTVNMVGRYYIFTVMKSRASMFIVKNATTGEYLIKGNEV